MKRALVAVVLIAVGTVIRARRRRRAAERLRRTRTWAERQRMFVEQPEAIDKLLEAYDRQYGAHAVAWPWVPDEPNGWRLGEHY